MVRSAVSDIRWYFGGLSAEDWGTGKLGLRNGNGNGNGRGFGGGMVGWWVLLLLVL